jgi:hypothetical protein
MRCWRTGLAFRRFTRSSKMSGLHFDFRDSHLWYELMRFNFGDSQLWYELKRLLTGRVDFIGLGFYPASPDGR